MATQHNTTADTCGDGRTEHADDVLYFSQDRGLTSGVRARQIMERAVIRTLAQTLLDAGYALRVYEGEEYAGRLTTNRDEIMSQIMSVDEEQLDVFIGDGSHEHARRYATIFLVYGNDGWDVIADYSSKLEVFMGPVNTLIDKLSA